MPLWFIYCLCVDHVEYHGEKIAIFDTCAYKRMCFFSEKIFALRGAAKGHFYDTKCTFRNTCTSIEQCLSSSMRKIDLFGRVPY